MGSGKTLIASAHGACGGLYCVRLRQHTFLLRRIGKELSAVHEVLGIVPGSFHKHALLAHIGHKLFREIVRHGKCRVPVTRTVTRGIHQVGAAELRVQILLEDLEESAGQPARCDFSSKLVGEHVEDVG